MPKMQPKLLAFTHSFPAFKSRQYHNAPVFTHPVPALTFIAQVDFSETGTNFSAKKPDDSAKC
jgi:hypothetical protein